MSLNGEACTKVYPKVSELAAVTEKGKKCSSLQACAIGFW